MTIRSKREPRAKHLYAEGVPIQRIAERLEVDRKTIQRWMKDWTPEERQQNGSTDPTYDPQIWPNWSIDDLTDLPGFDRPTWEQNLLQIDMAVKDNNRLTPWFFRRLIEFGKRYPDYPDGQLDWALAVAGLPPIGEWLGDGGSCALLADAIEEFKPWEWRRITMDRDKVTGVARRSYIKATTEISDRIGERIRSVSAQQSESNLDNWKAAGLLVAAFHERIPIFNRVPRRSNYRKFTLGGIVRGILVSKELDHVS